MSNAFVVKTGAAHADCPHCGWANASPELDEDGRPYTCFVCGNSGVVPRAHADAYWQDQTDRQEYHQLRPVVDGKHYSARYDQLSGDCYSVIHPLLPGACFPRAPRPFPMVSCGDDDLPF